MPNLDLRELQQACQAAGMPLLKEERVWVGSGMEAPTIAFALRDAVRKVLPASYCAPTLIEPDAEEDAPALCVIPRDAEMGFPEGVDMLIYGSTETECWANALVQIWRAGLLKEVEE